MFAKLKKTIGVSSMVKALRKERTYFYDRVCVINLKGQYIWINNVVRSKPLLIGEMCSVYDAYTNNWIFGTVFAAERDF